MEVRGPGFERSGSLEISGFICFDQIDTQGLMGFLRVFFGLCNMFLKSCIWQKPFITSSAGSELKSPKR